MACCRFPLRSAAPSTHRSLPKPPVTNDQASGRSWIFPSLLPSIGRAFQIQHVGLIVLAGLEPVAMGVQEAGAKFLVQRLAGSGARVSVDAMKMRRDAADERGLQDR